MANDNRPIIYLTFLQDHCFENSVGMRAKLAVVELFQNGKDTYRVAQKSKPDYFCNNFVYCQQVIARVPTEITAKLFQLFRHNKSLHNKQRITEDAEKLL